VEERLSALAMLVANGIPAGRLLPGVMTAAAGDARRLMSGIGALGCRAGLIMPPFFFTGDDDGVEAFVTHAASGAPDLPFLLYHYPAMSGFAYRPPLITRLVDRFGPQLAGIKDSTGDRGHTLDLIARFPNLSVFTGTDTDLVAVLAAGGAGIIGGVPNVNAAMLARRIADLDSADKAATDCQIAKLFALIAGIGGPVPIRTLLAEVHGDPEWLRTMPPLSPQPPAEAARLIAAFAAAGYRFSGEKD
jgi:4-hydroxy-tetrahydrodipicolinate synthase